jgi:hypothetical protein
MTQTLMHITQYSKHAGNEHQLAAHTLYHLYKIRTTACHNQNSYTQNKGKKPAHQKT